VVGTCAVLLMYLFGIGGFYSYAGRLRNTISAFLQYAKGTENYAFQKRYKNLAVSQGGFYF
jgi:hypothetical protein